MIAESPTTLSNVQRFLAYYCIEGVALDPSHPGNDPMVPGYDRSRIYALDTRGELLTHCTVHVGLWSRDAAKGIDSIFHKPGMRASFRSRTTPSMQVIFREVALPPGKPVHLDVQTILEIDFDERSPRISFLGHAREVAFHAVTGARTDPTVIARGLDTLLAPDPEQPSPVQHASPVPTPGPK